MPESAVRRSKGDFTEDVPNPASPAACVASGRRHMALMIELAACKGEDRRVEAVLCLRRLSTDSSQLCLSGASELRAEVLMIDDQSRVE